MVKAQSWFGRALLLVAGVLVSSTGVKASGPPERLAQVLVAPKDPNRLVIRYGFPTKSNGFLISSDGGKSFRAVCSSMIGQVSLRRSVSPYVSPTVVDGDGRIVVAQDQDQFYIGDPTGCSFEKVPGFTEKTVASVALDPADPNVMYLLTYFRDAESIARTEVLRRDANGKITTLGAIQRPDASEHVLGDGIAVARVGDSVRIAVYYATWVGFEDSKFFLAFSEDGGANFTHHAFNNITDKTNARLLGFDPKSADRLIAVEYADALKDKLYVSNDKGATWAPWGEVDQFSGIAFAADGRPFVSAQSDSLPDPVGGLYTAAKVGDPLTRLPNSVPLDCVTYRASDQKLLGCMLTQFGTLDAATGAFTKTFDLSETTALVECPGKDSAALCKAELNAGPSWCCAGHYPFTPFCGMYDVSTGGKLCGLSGRVYECAAGNGPPGCDGSDAGVVVPPGDGGTSTSGDGGTKNPGGGTTNPGGGTTNPGGGTTNPGGGTTNPGGSTGGDAGTARPSVDGGSTASDGGALEGDDDDDGTSAKKKDDGCTLSPGADASGGFALVFAAAALVLNRRRRARS